MDEIMKEVEEIMKESSDKIGDELWGGILSVLNAELEMRHKKRETEAVIKDLESEIENDFADTLQKIDELMSLDGEEKRIAETRVLAKIARIRDSAITRDQTIANLHNIDDNYQAYCNAYFNGCIDWFVEQVTLNK